MSATLNTTPGRRLPVPRRQRTVGWLVTTAVVLAVVVGLTAGRITLDTAPSALTDAEVDTLYAPDYAVEGDLV